MQRSRRPRVSRGMVPHPLRLVFCLASLVAAAVGTPARARAQGAPGAPDPLEIRGRFLADPGPRPLAGAYVTLLNAGGVVVGATLTNEAGWFALTAPAAGRYTVHAENIGYATQETSVEVPAAQPRLIELRSTFQAIQVEGVTAEVDKECRVPAATAERVASLWDEVRKAFRVTAFVEDKSMVLFDVDRWTRTLEPDRLTVQEEQRRPRTGLHPGSPFVSRPPDELAEKGYVQGERGDAEIRYYGPDAHVLLDRSFQDTHCFGLRTKAPEKGWMGLQFRPRDKRAMDIEGTLWIDKETYAPRRLDYRYAQLPWPLDTDKVGGRVEFTRIPEGPWVVDRWWIRMPVVQERSFRMSPSAAPETRYSLAAVIEEGGEVRRARTDDQHVVTFAMGTVDGVVMDSLGGGPVQGARVGVVGTFFQATTGPDGRFRFTDVPQGHYAISASSEELAVVSPELRTAEVEVTAGATAAVTLTLPSAAAVARRSCPEPLTEGGPSVIVGTVRGADGTLVPGAAVQVSWDVVRGGVVGLSQTTRQGTVSVRDDGSFTVCGVPQDEALRVAAVAPGFTAEPVSLRFEDDAFRMLDLVLTPADMAPEPLLVRVLGPGGKKPVEAATVHLPELDRSLATDAAGNAVFTGVPVGPVVVSVEHLSYEARTDTVQVAATGRTAATVTLSDKAYELEPITVEILTPEAVEARSRGSSSSAKLSAPQIQTVMKEKGAKNVAEVIRRSLPGGVRISPLVHGLNYVGTCIESSRGAMGYRKLKQGGPSACAMVQVVVDGAYLTDEEAARLVESFPLMEIVSMEFLSPMEESFRFGTGRGNGMLLIETARR